MVKPYLLKIQRLLRSQAIYLLFIFCIYCPDLWASQEAIVLKDKAVIYSDKEMTSPVGFVARGKKIVVGEIARNKGQVYPIIVSGKIAYIRVNDISTEKETLTSTRLTAERFRKSAYTIPESKLVVSYFAFTSQIRLKDDTNQIADKDMVIWHGASLKGEVLVKNSFDVQIIANYMGLSQEDSTFRAIEFGVGGAYRLIDKKKILLRLEAQLLSVPFSSYEVGDDFRVKSYGYTAGAGINLTYLFGEHWGAEAFAGVYRTALLGFDAPAPYDEISPTFVGNRVGLGFNFTY